MIADITLCKGKPNFGGCHKCLRAIEYDKAKKDKNATSMYLFNKPPYNANSGNCDKQIIIIAKKK